MFKWAKKVKHNRVVKRRRKARFECSAHIRLDTPESAPSRIMVMAVGYEGQPYHAVALAISRLVKESKLKKFTMDVVDIEHAGGMEFDMDRLKRIAQKYYGMKS